MKLSEIGEFGLISRIAQDCHFGDPCRILKGIGDDAAVVCVGNEALVVTTDLMVERVHFVRGDIPPYQLGYKSIAVSLSDIAAMGAAPLDIYVSIAVPEAVPLEEVDAIFCGMKDLARATATNLLGGDTTASRQDLVINSAITGTAKPEEILYRHAAQPGDVILVSGELGDSAGGLYVARHRPDIAQQSAERLLLAHYQPALYLREARLLASSGQAHAGIDLSDGLSSDLGHICRASNCGAEISATALPISNALQDLCRNAKLDPLQFALSGGEDYRLLVTVHPAAAARLLALISQETGRQFYVIGRITTGSSIILRRADGSAMPVGPSGYDHFHRPNTQASPIVLPMKTGDLS